MRCARPSAALSWDPIRFWRYKESARGRHPMAARDCACVRTYGGSKKATMNRIGRERTEESPKSDAVAFRNAIRAGSYSQIHSW